jgi:hypothetical protein
MTGPVVGIHQPNFLPWLGYFDKIRQADVFVLLDDAQFPKKGATWTNRVRMLVSGAPAWVTVPIKRGYHGTREVREIRIDDSRPWREKTVRTLEQSYGRAPCADEVVPLVRELLEEDMELLAELNERGIRRLAGGLGLTDRTRLVRSSELGVGTTATERLIDLVRAVDGAIYLSGAGAGGYQDESLFAHAGIELRVQEFEHPSYAQAGSGDFVAGLSAVDALAAVGLDGVRRLLAEGRA